MQILHQYIAFLLGRQDKFCGHNILEQKKEPSWFSYRYFAFKVKMDHSNLVKLVLGKRHASKEDVEAYGN